MPLLPQSSDPRYAYLPIKRRRRYSRGAGSRSGSASSEDDGSEAEAEAEAGVGNARMGQQPSSLARSISETVKNTLRSARGKPQQEWAVLPDTTPKSPWYQKIKEVFKPVKKRRGKQADEEKLTKLQKFVKSTGFKFAVLTAIALSCVSTALEVDHASWRIQGAVRVHIFTFLNNIFIVFFSGEIILRIAAVGPYDFFTRKEFLLWNLLDLSIIAIGVLNQFSVDYLAYRFNDENVDDEYHPYNKGNEWTATLGRVFRTTRVMRVLHIFRQVPNLRVLAEGLIAAVTTVFWMMVLTFFIIFSFSIVMTMIIRDNMDAFTPEEQTQMRELWGSVGATMFTSFQFLTMDGWSGIYRDLVTRLPYLRLLVCPFIFFGGFVIMSCLTGVMTDIMNEVRKRKEESDKRESAADVRHIVESVKEVDADKNGVLDEQEFLKLFAPKTQFVRRLKDAHVEVDQKDGYELFPWFDADSSGSIRHEEIVEGVETLINGITGITLFKLAQAIRSADKFVQDQSTKHPGEDWSWLPNSSGSPNQNRLVDEAVERLTQLEARTDEFEAAIRAFTRKFDYELNLHEETDSEISGAPTPPSGCWCGME